MRMAFGLVGILVALGAVILILSHFYLPYTQTVLHEGQKAQEQAAQIAGYGKDGGKAMDSLTLDADVEGGKLHNMIVTSIVPGGAMETYFGLKRNDCIVEAYSQQIRDMQDAQMAKDMILMSYQHKRQLVVLRDGQRIILPVEKPAAGPGKSGSNNPINSQLDAIEKIPMH